LIDGAGFDPEYSLPIDVIHSHGAVLIPFVVGDI